MSRRTDRQSQIQKTGISMTNLLQAAGLTIALAAPTSQAPEKLSVDQAIAIIRPIYNALTASLPEHVRAELEGVTTADWQNCGSNDTCEDRESTIQRWSGRITRVPDFSFEIKDVVSDGNRIVVRSEAKGTAAGDFLGVAHSGRSFRIMTVDIHEIKDGKVARTFHVEDWARAMRQLGGKD
jgi:predicted ester cyclase